MITIKILHFKAQMRYSVRRVVNSACGILRKEYPGMQFRITEVKDVQEIFKYTPILVAPGLVINEKLVYDTWIPSQEQVLGWLRTAVQNQTEHNSSVSEVQL